MTFNAQRQLLAHSIFSVNC